MAIRKNIMLEQEDMDIVEFFIKKGYSLSDIVRAALRQHYQWYSAAAVSGEKAYVDEKNKADDSGFVPD